jgi:hypothetical protein
MARGPRRVAAPEEDESDDDTGVEPMSPNTRRKHDQILIMQVSILYFRSFNLDGN